VVLVANPRPPRLSPRVLIDNLLSCLDKPDKDIDELWAKEAEGRIDAYEKGKIKAVTLERVLKKYK
jgi:hypothetical protein